MKLIIKHVICFAIILVFGVLSGILMDKFDINPDIIRVFQVIISISAIVLLIYISALYFKTAFKAFNHIEELMTAFLSIASEHENSAIFAETYATLLSFDRKSYITPCYIGLTDTKLMMIVANRLFVPEQIFGFELTELKLCKISRYGFSKQHKLKLRYGRHRIKLVIPLSTVNLKNQEINATQLIEELRKLPKS